MTTIQNFLLLAPPCTSVVWNYVKESYGPLYEIILVYVEKTKCEVDTSANVKLTQKHLRLIVEIKLIHVFC